MANLTMLHWKRTPSASYTYGSKIEYHHDGSVGFVNPLQAPGTAMHYWENLPMKADRKPHVQIPLLKRGQKYAYHVEATVVPDRSVTVNLRFMGDGDHIIAQYYGQHLDGEFTMPEDANNYRLELLNINNKKIRFFSCYLAPAAVMQAIKIAEPVTNRLFHVHDDTKSAGKEMVVLRQRVPNETFELSEMADQYYLRIPADRLNDEEEIHSIAEQAYKALRDRQSFDEPFNWRMTAHEVVLARSICQNVFQGEK
ncbi:accessory Sec system protein Asp3 [Lacticaseibacillus chiayiensis]|uniref:accessory Sec system protein Asp3 n=1 Tax=Lacticaseibacillus chiayiensis TaxID=2100821 RepID=UPI0010114DB3|nr:accessory Sec system protein Asp3 [Lacticaseibacillus chiayiensis]RXT58858.1 accessory Sec system protein Asp3 [Lacticaseibacillus chiayiensis]